MYKPNGLKNAYDWPRILKNPENLRSTRRWCQITRRNYLQNGWNGEYEFFMFNKRPDGHNALMDDFWDQMQEVYEDCSETDSDRSISPRNSVTWANEMQLSEGVDVEEYPFSEDEESVQIDFPEENLNDWESSKWRSNYAIAINEAYQKVYEHNEAIKNDPGMSRKKPIDIDPFWGFALQQIMQRNKEDEEKETNVQENSGVDIEDGEAISDVTSTSLHAYDTDDNTIVTEGSMNDAVIDIKSDLLEESDAIDRDDTERVNNASVESNDDTEQMAANSDVSAEVLLVERQEEVIVLQENEIAAPILQENSPMSSLRFDFEDFKARLLRFKNRTELNHSDSCNKKIDLF